MVKKSDLKKLNSIMQEGNEFKNLKEYNKAVEKYLEALSFIEERIKEPEERVDETTNIKSQIDQIYSVKIIDIIETASNFIDKVDFNSAFNTFDEAMRIADKIVDKDMKDYEVNQINYLINKTKIEESLFQGNTIKERKEFDKAISMLRDTLNAAKEFYMEDLEDEMIKKIENSINETYSLKVNILVEKGSGLRESDNLDGALEAYKTALKLVDNYFESDLKKSDKKNLENLSNHIYSNKIKTFTERGQKLFGENKFNEAAKNFEEALKISEKMYDTEEKELEIKKINTVASGVLNPIYLEKMNPILNKGKELLIKDNFEENISIVNEAIDLFEKSLEITNTMADSKEKSEKLNEITTLIDKTCKTRIKYIKEKSIQKIGQGDYGRAINDLYAAISVAKRMSIAEEDNEDLEDLKNTVNKVYLAQIEEVVSGGVNKLEKKDYDEAIKIFNKALEMTNKMYLTHEMEEEINKIKGLVYQAELKDLVDRGDLSEELQKYEKELEKLNKKMDYAKTIGDPSRKFQEMEEIKKSIDEVFHSKIKLLVEQGVQLADSKNFKDSFKNFEAAITINESIKSPEFKNRIAIKYEYKLKLIDKAQLEIEKQNYDIAIEDCNKAIELDSTFIDAYYHIGIANNKKHEYDTAIGYFKKSIDLSPNHAKSWNHMGFSHEKLGQLDKAIDSYKKAVGFEPKYVLANYNLGNAYKQEKQLDNAIGSYKKATEIDPNYAHAWLFMGYAYLDKNDYYSAIQNLDKAININPDLGKEIKSVISNIKNSIENLNKDLLEKFTNK
ncbi:MAG: tetratricopeptide repeat protein [Candidatus Lokiarchaeota archaeon]|nr:tetratricopeptide repeat protein [Candidatus Lokiarchaeota archaeon]